MKLRIRPFAILALLHVIAPPAPASDPQPTPEDVRFFETKIRPVLAEKCFKCHGPAKQKAQLRLDTAEGFQKGGDSGNPLVVPGKPDESLLLRAVRHTDGVEKMPPEGKLKDAEIADLAAWVKRGAHFPATAKAVGTDPSKHWAFQPVVRPEVPEIRDAKWVVNPIDAFVLAKLETAEKQTIPTLPEDFKGNSNCADLKITPDGKYLYGTNRGHDSIAAYSIADDGKLSLIVIEPSLGKGPQNLAIPAGGEWLICANMPGNNVAVFKIDPGTGRLKSAGDPVKQPGPSCIILLP